MLVFCMNSSQGLVSEKNIKPATFGKILMGPILPQNIYFFNLLKNLAWSDGKWIFKMLLYFPVQPYDWKIQVLKLA